MNTKNDVLSIEGILPFLTAKETANKIIVYDSLESTNITARQLALSGERNNYIIICDHQTNGKGRYNRNFFSPANCGIYMSFLMYPNNQQTFNSGLVTCHAAVSVCKAIERVTKKVPQIKWVNDIFLNNKKICGISANADICHKTKNVNFIIIGIGINFVTPPSGFPANIKDIAGSIFEDYSEIPPDLNRNKLAAEVINQLLGSNFEYDKKTMLKEYKSRLMILGKRVTITGVLEPFEATAIDIDESGQLIVKKDNGEIVSLVCGEVSVKL